MENISEIIIFEDFSIKAAMEQMTRAKKGILLVLNESNQLLGILSDGDVRRGILNGAIMISPASQLMNTDPVVEYNIHDALALLKSKSLGVVPVIDKSKRLTAVVVEENGSAKTFEMLEKQSQFRSEESTLIIIPARGGSKRIPHKNLQKIGGYSLISRTISVAQEAFKKANIIVSTDDTEITKEAERRGVKVPWLRPSNLATDTTSSFEVVEHALKWAIAKLPEKLDTVILLEPTAPLRKAFHLVEAVNLFHNSRADSVVGVCKIPHVFHPEEILKIKDGLLTPFKESSKMHTRVLRGNQENLYVQNGIIYVFKPSIIQEKKNMYGDRAIPYLVEWKYFADIDEPIDLITAEAKLKLV